ncbi:hypothetical protein XHV734_0298 [Xanthomonas hortorum pv. vitians]|nr:hypothetical protein XHV734_0298 [Xanthomonas hortorum pv. vitians]
MLRALHAARPSDAVRSDRLLSICNVIAIPDITPLVNEGECSQRVGAIDAVLERFR